MLNKLLSQPDLKKNAYFGEESFVEEHPNLTAIGAGGLALTEYTGDLVNSFLKHNPELADPETSKLIRDRIESEGSSINIKDMLGHQAKFDPKKRVMNIDRQSADIPEFLSQRYAGDVFDQTLSPKARYLMDLAKKTRRVSKYMPLATLLSAPLLPEGSFEDNGIGGMAMNAASIGGLLSSPVVMHREVEALHEAKKIIEEAAARAGKTYSRNPLKVMRPGLVGQSLSSIAMVLVPQLLKERMQVEEG